MAAPRAKLGRDIVLEVIRSAGSRGMTDEEMQLATGLNPSTQRPRRIDLCNSGLVVDGGKKRLTRSLRPATVWEFVTASHAPSASPNPTCARPEPPDGGAQSLL